MSEIDGPIKMPPHELESWREWAIGVKAGQITPPPMMSTDLFIRALDHGIAVEAEHAALMTRAMKDADRVGNAYIEFTNQQTARIEALKAEIVNLIAAKAYSQKQFDELTKAADNLIDEQEASIHTLEAALHGIIDDCTLKSIYVGPFYEDAARKVKARAAEALKANG